MGKPCIAVIGASRATPEEIAWAEDVGRRLAEAGIVLICGGLGGVMEAACRGAKSAGGFTVGVLPGDRRETGNEWLDLAIPTGIGYARNCIVAYSGEVVIAIGGSSGTLCEIAYATVASVPVVSLGSWRLDERPLSHGLRPVPADDPEDAVAKALALLKEVRRG